MITARDAMGREITFPHYELLAGFEFRGEGDWIAESDLRVLDWLESGVRNGFDRSECGCRGIGRFSDGTGEISSLKTRRGTVKASG